MSHLCTVETVNNPGGICGRDGRTTVRRFRTDEHAIVLYIMTRLGRIGENAPGQEFSEAGGERDRGVPAIPCVTGNLRNTPYQVG